MASRSLRSPVLRAVINSVQKLYPTALANQTWDNTGLLLEAPPRSGRRTRPKHLVLLTIDLTRAVADEAISLHSSVIISYHPVIFRPLKSLTLADPQQESLLRLAQEGISVYSPHTAVDAATGGVNDWLASLLGPAENEESRAVLEAVDAPPEGFEGAGMGRLVTLKEGLTLMEVVERVKVGVNMSHLMVSATPSHKDGSSLIRRIALCAGSGGSLFKGLDVDLFFTGELSHHEALAGRENGISTIACFHTNTERGFLAAVMKKKLSDALAAEWASIAGEEGADAGFEIVVSREDRDPYEII